MPWAWCGAAGAGIAVARGSCLTGCWVPGGRTRTRADTSRALNSRTSCERCSRLPRPAPSVILRPGELLYMLTRCSSRVVCRLGVKAFVKAWRQALDACRGRWLTWLRPFAQADPTEEQVASAMASLVTASDEVSVCACAHACVLSCKSWGKEGENGFRSVEATRRGACSPTRPLPF